MKSVGEVMAIGRTFKQAFAKAMRSRELDQPADLSGDLLARLETPGADRYDLLLEAFRRGATEDEVHARTAIDPWYLRELRGLALDPAAAEAGVRTYRAVDTCAAEFAAETPYFYSALERPPAPSEVQRGDRASVMILGSGPNRIGQGIEFDYCCVHAAMTVRESGRDAVMVNCNPETVSTDYDTSDRLYFEPLTLEDVLGIVEVEQPEGVIVQFGGQTPLKLAAGLEAAGVPLLGTSPEAIDLAEDRGRFGALLERLGLKAPPYATARGPEAALAAAPRVGFPLLVRPSYVLGGRAMELVYSEDALADYLRRTGATDTSEIFLDRFLENAIEVDVDAICDGEDVWIGGIMQHVEEAGIHSGDSACVLPPHSLGTEMLREIREATSALALELGVVGLINVQYGVLGDELYVIEANPRASRTVPFVSKATGLPLAKIACRVMLGERIADMDLPIDPDGDHVSVKEAVLPFDRFAGADALLGPEMRSTGEVMGVAAGLPGRVRQGPGRGGRAAARRRHGVPDRHGLRQGGGRRDRRAAARPRLHRRRDARDGGGDRAHGHPGRDAEQARGGVAARRRQDRGRRRGAGHQHADRHRGARGRLRDPPRRDRPRHPVHHDDVGRDGRGARDRRRAPRRRRRCSRCRRSTAPTRRAPGSRREPRAVRPRAGCA